MSVAESIATLRAHPCFDRCFCLYRNALRDWHASGAIQNAAATLGMNCRAYCDARLSVNQFQWTASGTGEDFTRAHVELAYREAVDDVCGIRAANGHERTPE